MEKNITRLEEHVISRLRRKEQILVERPAPFLSSLRIVDKQRLSQRNQDAGEQDARAFGTAFKSRTWGRDAEEEDE